MSNGVEADACLVRLNYKMAMIEINTQLGRRDIASLKFLCAEFFSVSMMERIRTGLDIIQALQQMCLISEPDNILFLAELLLLIGRNDLLCKLNVNQDDVKLSLSNMRPQSKHVSPYRMMLHNICQELTRENVPGFLFLCPNSIISQSVREQINDAQDLLYILEQRNAVGPHNLNFLSSVLAEIHRRDLAWKVAEHCRRRGIQRLEDDNAVLPNTNIHGKTGQVTPSSVSQLLPRSWQESPNEVVTYNPARVLEPDDAVPLTPPSQHVPVSTTRPSDAHDPRVLYSVPQTQIDRIIHSIEEEMLATGISANNDEEMPRYSMSSNPRGICLIINNEKFFQVPTDSHSKKMPDRPGTNVDCESLKRIFTDLHFMVRVQNNLTRDELVHHMKLESLCDHQHYDCFVCCILSHGAIGAVYGTDGKTVPIKDLTVFFKASSCPSLCGKPKMFFIQACQGPERQISCPSSRGAGDVEEDRPSSAAEVETVPDEADFLLAMATVAGYVSFRSKSEGSWYITTLVRMLERYAKQYDLLSILTKVNQVVSEAATRDGNHKQVPAPTHTLRKRICFGGV